MNKNRWMMVGLFAGISVMAVAQEGTSAVAASKEDTSGWKFGPFIGGSCTYDDNVDSMKNGREDAYFQYSLGTDLLKKTDTIHSSSRVWFADRFYDDSSDMDSNRWGGSSVLEIFSDKSFFSGVVDFREVSDSDDAPAAGAVPSGFSGVADPAFDRSDTAQQRDLFNFGLTAGHQLTDDTAFSVGYGFYKIDYQTGMEEDWFENSIATEWSLRLTDKTVSYMNAEYALQNGDGAPDDSETTTVRLGLKNKLTDKSSVRVGVGAVRYDGENTSKTKPSFEVEALWDATEKVSFFVHGKNKIQPTGTGGNVEMSSRAAAGGRYQMTPELGFILGGAYIYDEQLDGAKDKSRRKIATARIEYSMNSGLDLYASGEVSGTGEDAAADYSRFRGVVGAKFVF